MIGFRRGLPAIVSLVVAGCIQSGSPPQQPTASPPPATAETTAQGATAPAATARPATSAVPVLADPIRRIAVPGTAPAAMAVTQDGVWVYAIESGDVTLIDPDTGTQARSVHIGGLGSHIVMDSNFQLFVARFDTGGAGSYLVQIDSATGAIKGGSTGALGALTASDGFLFALQKDDKLLRIDELTLAATASATVDIDDEHMEVILADDAVWAASDHTPLRRLTLVDLQVTDTIDVGGGIPFVVAGGQIYGARPGTLWILDPTTEAVTREIPLPGVAEILGMDVDIEAGEAWLGVRMTGRVGAVLRLDLAGGAVVGTAAVSLPAAVKIAGADVYVASYLDNELLVYRR